MKFILDSSQGVQYEIHIEIHIGLVARILH